MNGFASKEEKITSLTPELKATLHCSILDYLHRSGYSKTFKRFQSEAEIKSDSWKDSSVHLEDIFCKYNSSNGDSNLNTNKKTGNDEVVKKDNISATNETTTKKKKKGIEDESNVANNKITESEDTIVTETKPKKKKTKHNLELEESKSDELKKPVNDTTNGSEMDDSVKKTKDKKKKGIQQENESVTEVAQKESKKKKKNKSTAENEKEVVDEAENEKKSSKKRKRSSDENDKASTEVTITEESKCQKTENEINLEISNEHENGKFEINGEEKPAAQKSAKKQKKDSTEPKTINAFQRVKIEEVEFAHQKLQDNSYWAKDGADIGYGAKAQEVLGQVRGRDFRHEKTKKKRGSYRGGLIDQESHSIKFNYSDEE